MAGIPWPTYKCYVGTNEVASCVQVQRGRHTTARMRESYVGLLARSFVLIPAVTEEIVIFTSLQNHVTSDHASERVKCYGRLKQWLSHPAIDNDKVMSHGREARGLPADRR